MKLPSSTIGDGKQEKYLLNSGKKTVIDPCEIDLKSKDY